MLFILQLTCTAVRVSWRINNIDEWGNHGNIGNRNGNFRSFDTSLFFDEYNNALMIYALGVWYTMIDFFIG